MGNDGGQWDLMGQNVTIWCVSADSALHATSLKLLKNTWNHGFIRLLPIKSQFGSMGTHGQTILTPGFGFSWSVAKYGM
jgi:hypothetical protein